MIASEFAFLALGLVLGAASGAALVIVLRSRPPTPEVRVTVSHDAVPRRAATLSSDVFAAAAGEPARGGPADRRRLDRPDGAVDQPAPHDATGRGGPSAAPRPGLAGRTSVSFGAAVRAGVPIVPERDEALEGLRTHGAAAAARMFGSEGRPSASSGEPVDADVLEPSGQPTMGSVALATEPVTEPAAPPPPTASAIADPRTAAPTDEPILAPATVTPTSTSESIDVAVDTGLEALDDTPSLTRILRGDHHALFAASAALAAADSMDQAAWERAIRSVTDAIVTRTIAAGWLDFPVGNPFWDTFTVPQCRDIAGALAAAGHRFDGVDGWEHGRVPNYRDLTIAVAGAGLEPRRVRAWPTQEEMDDLYLEVSAAPDEFVAVHAPNLDMEELHDLVGFGDTSRALLWANWDRARAVLTAPIPPD